MAILKEAYPFYYKDKSKEELIASVNLWFELFKDDDVNLVKAAIKAHIASDTKGFPPVIGQIKDKLYKLTANEEKTEQEAWYLVNRAIRNSAYHATEEFEKLPKTIQEVIGGPSQLKEWSQLEVSKVQTVVASNFMRSYTVKVERKQEFQALPNDVKAVIENLTNRLCLGGGESE